MYGKYQRRWGRRRLPCVGAPYKEPSSLCVPRFGRLTDTNTICPSLPCVCVCAGLIVACFCGGTLLQVYALTDLGKSDNLVDALFGLEMEEEFKCEESGESKVSTATAKKLVCNIQGGAGSNTQASRPVFVNRKARSLVYFHGRCRPNRNTYD